MAIWLRNIQKIPYTIEYPKSQLYFDNPINIKQALFIACAFTSI